MDAATRPDRFVPAAAAVLGAVLYALAHHSHPDRPVAGVSPSGWFTWFDAGRYLRAATAWTHLDLRASEHWYPPGYPILGALGHAFTPVQPFYLPDALALVISAWLFPLLAAEMLGKRPGARSLGALIFLATTALNPAALDVWVTPWSTTPATPFIYGCLLAGMRFIARPRPPTCFMAGLLGGSVALFRPTEAAIILLSVGLAMLWALVRQPVPLSRIGHIVLMGMTGAILPGLGFVAGMSATGGFAPTGYLGVSNAFGFEWRMIALHWVEIFGDPRPLWPGERGMVSAFPWIVPGFAGMAVALVCCSRATRLNHVLLAGSASLHCLVFLAYRDMHPNQVWWIFLYHYFKWVLPVLGLYAGLLPVYLLGRRRAIAIPVAIVTMLGLFAWRPELTPVSFETRPAIGVGAHTLRIPSGLGSVRDAVAVPAQGSFDAVFHSVHELVVDGRVFHSPFDFRAFPRPGGLLLLPVRPLPSGDTVITFSPGITLEADSRPFVARQQLMVGLPCWIASRRAVCDPAPPLPGPVLRLGRTVEFRGEGAEYRGEGWAAPEPIGCWTNGPEASLGFRVPDRGARDVVLELIGYGYAPGPATRPSRITISANGRQIADVEPPAQLGVLRIVIPAERFGPDGRMQLRLGIADPRSPADFGEGTDWRRLGLMVQSIRLAIAD